jgi:hypothetical protein
MSRAVAIYFSILFGLTFLALTPNAITMGMLLFFIPGMILVACPTLLYYSLSLLPAYFVKRLVGNRPLAAAMAVIGLLAAAFLPHYASEYSLRRLTSADHADPAGAAQPRSFQLPLPEAANYWTNWRSPASSRRTSIPCADLCQQLLFKGGADQVLVREPSNPLSDGTMVITGVKVFRLSSEGLKLISESDKPVSPTKFSPKWRRFRLERRSTCPDTLSLISIEFVREVIGGRCLVEETVDNGNPDAVLSVSYAPVRSDTQQGESDPIRNFKLQEIEHGPMTITISEQRAGQLTPVEVNTSLAARYAKAPFYFTAARCGGAGIPNLCLAIATDPFAASAANPYERLDQRYHMSLAKTPVPPRLAVLAVTEGDRATVDAILSGFYRENSLIPTTQMRFVTSFVNARLKSGELTQDDIQTIRALLKQRAFVDPIETKLPSSTYDALKTLLPDMFERIAHRTDQQGELVQSLVTMVDHFSADSTDQLGADLCQGEKNADLRICRKRESRSPR